MEKNVVNWFEIPVADLNRAKAFYTNTLGCEVQDMPSPNGDMEMAAFPWINGAENSTGALVKSQFNKPHAGGTMVYFTCEDCQPVAEKAAANGGKIISPKMPIGEFGFIAQVQDTEGNIIGLHSER